MWFKQIQLFQLMESHFTPDDLIEKLEELAFRPCLPSMQQSLGWVSLIDADNAPLIQSINGKIMLCLQIEDKILPPIVIRQELDKKIKHIEASEARKVRPKEKSNLRDDITATFLPRAFSKLTKIYGYIDTKNNWLVLGTTNEKKTEQFLSIFKKSVSENIHPFQLKKLSTTITHWVKHQNYPTVFSIEKTGVLQDPNQEGRIIRCQQQDLFANGIQSLIKDGCEVKQIGIEWQDRVNFVLSDKFLLHGIKYQDEIKAQAKEMEGETLEQQFIADFFIMSESLDGLLKDLLNEFIESEKIKPGGNVIDIDKIVSKIDLT